MDKNNRFRRFLRRDDTFKGTNADSKICLGFSSQTRLRYLLGDAWFPACEDPNPRQDSSHVLDLLLQASKFCKVMPLDLIVENTASPGFTPKNPTIQYLPALSLAVRNYRYYASDRFRFLRRFCLRSSCESMQWRSMLDEFGERQVRETARGAEAGLLFFLRRCEVLQDLEISFVDERLLEERLVDMPYLPILGIFDVLQRRPPLRNLKLSNCKMSEPDIVKFLVTFSETLRMIHFTNLYLTSGSRHTVFEQLGGEMDLTSAIFDGFYHKDDLWIGASLSPANLPYGLARDLPPLYKPDKIWVLEWLCGKQIEFLTSFVVARFQRFQYIVSPLSSETSWEIMNFSQYEGHSE